MYKSALRPGLGVAVVVLLAGLLATQSLASKSKPSTPSCIDVARTIVGTWNVANAGTGTTGQVKFSAGGSYSISGTYNAGGTFLGKTGGTYQVLTGGAIAFTYAGSASVNRIAVVQCATRHGPHP